jgi:hypothetical protein
MESTEPDVVITGETPNKQLKSQVTYDYRTPTNNASAASPATALTTLLFQCFQTISEIELA